ncbi:MULTISPECIES: hypothetical protein [Ruegeria]|jgi:hypothetical protein|uniref:Major facilitator superfamily (MFS) profile domain-containing protein n=1 Tax=Ruegeria atlantica TaxID=81569 RepID=A0ABX1W7N7_9RHOB|nr:MULTISPECIES: hypothetical protein [Ruegeria]NOC44072.1 hypothetical protein [Ruegeria sp. HKCCD7559]NOC84070.1 hypothetical protein [Ruegeria sp. HKCCD6428]NOC91346.1 hypothetical protein [Ruegeria sp. HKCCD6604]NOD28803.1 hypothetical protein [Ruegeria atlantica]NOD82802.1 hypothetical protein [Ruegeria sp. HKCCD6119]
MASVATFAYLPILSFLLGAAAGFTAGRWLGLRGLLWLIGLASAVGLALIVVLAGIGTGEEEQAFGPLVWLTAGVLPFLFAAIMGGVGGRSLAVRADA